MNPIYNRKLQSALISAGKQVEAKIKEPASEMEDIHSLFYRLEAVEHDPIRARRASTELIAALLKYQIEKL